MTYVCFNPRSLHRERRFFYFLLCASLLVSIHAPYIGSDLIDAHAIPLIYVSIHAPYIGSDLSHLEERDDYYGFNPRSLHRERRYGLRYSIIGDRVSIHAPYIGSDGDHSSMRAATSRFNPRSLHRERPMQAERLVPTMKFQSTLPT